MKRVTFVLLCFAFLCFVNESYQEDQSGVGFLNDTHKWIHELPRTKFNGDSVNNSLFEASSDDYYQSFGVIAVVMFVLPVISVIIGIVFIVGRFMCDSCGGSSAALTYDEYKCQRIILTAWIIILSFCLFFLIAVGVWGCVWFAMPGGKDVKNSLEVQSANDSQIMTDLMAAFVAADNNTKLQGFYDSVIDGATEITDRADHAGYVLSDVAESIRITGFTVMYFLALIVACVMPIAALFHWEHISLCFGVFCFFLIFGIWCVIICHFLLDVGLSDLCFDLENVTVTAILNNRLAETQIVNNTARNDNLLGLMGESVFFCLPPDVTDACRDWALHLQEMNPSLNSTSLFWISQIDYLARCTWIENTLNPNIYPLCTKQIDGATLVWATAFGIALLLFPMAIFGILGFKRFRHETYGLYSN